MGRSNWPPSIVPNEKDQTVYLVANDFGKPDRAWAEAEYERTDLEAVIQDPLQANTAIRSVSSLSTRAEGWSEDVSEDVAHELRRRCDLQMRDIPFFLHEFTDRYEGRDRDTCRSRPPY